MKTTRRAHVPYSDEIVAEICEALANSHFGVRYLCRHKENWPAEATIYRWLEAYPSFRERYARARQLQIDALVTDIIEIASDTSNDVLKKDDGSYQANYAAIQRDRLKIDAIKWIASKLIPKVYGESKEPKDNGQDAISQFRVEE